MTRMGRYRWCVGIASGLVVLGGLSVGVTLAAWGRLPGLRLGADRALLTTALAPANRPATGPLRVHPQNRRYFMDASGRAVLLAGAHTWYTLVDSGFSAPPAPFDYPRYLESLVANGQNFFRMFAFEQARWSVLVAGDYYISPSPYRRPGPGLALDGQPRFDVSAFNQDYFDRLRSRVRQAGARGIYVAVQLFDGFSVEAKPFMAAQNPWPGHPLNKANNINGLDGDLDGDGQGREVHTLANPAVTAVQDAYVRRIIDAVNDLDNVLFEICNESNADGVAWQAHMIALIRADEAARPKQHAVGMTVPWPDGTNDVVMRSAADWVSPNGLEGHFTNPPPTDGRKVVVNDTDHLCFPCGDTPFVWRTVLRGMNPAFMDPYDCRSDVASDCDPAQPKWVALRQNLGYARALLEQTNLAALTPQPTACSTGYCLVGDAAAPEAVVYLPAGRTAWTVLDWFGQSRRRPAWYFPSDSHVTVDLSFASGELAVDWFDPATGQLTTGETIVGGARRGLTAPFVGQAVLHIHPRRTMAGGERPNVPRLPGRIT